MEEVPSGAIRFRRFLSHAPWWIIASSLGVTFLAVTSVIHFQEAQKPQEISYVLSAPRDLSNSKIEPKPEDDGIQAAPIPMPDNVSLDPTLNLDPTLDLPPEIVPFSERTQSGGGDEEGTIQGDPNLPAAWNKDGRPFNSIGVGAGSGLERGGPGGTGRGGDRPTIGRYPNPTTMRQKSIPIEETLDGLLWLARHQGPDGAWHPDGFAERCKGMVCTGTGRESFTVGCTGLSLLAFLGAGFDQRNRRQFYDKVLERNVGFDGVVRRALRWLMDRQADDGSFGSVSGEFFYNHAIATMAVCEAYAMAKNDLSKEAATKAVDFLVRNQSADPSGTGLCGWRYLPGTNESDTSVTGWCVMALKSAELAGLGNYSGAMDGAMNFIQQATAPNGLVGYQGRGDAGRQAIVQGVNEDFANHPALTAVGMCIRTFARHRAGDPMLSEGAKHLLADLPAWDPVKKTLDYYYWYYGSLALYQFDGPESPRRDGSLWKRWNQAMLAALVGHQKKTGAGCQLGSWGGDDRWGFAGGRLYATAINTLTMEVYYRYPNAFVGLGKEPKAQAFRTGGK